MRKLIGGLVLVAGVAALGLWARGDHAKDMEAQITAMAAEAAEGSIHKVSATVSGRDIKVTGIADSEAERDAIVTALDTVEGRRVVNDQLIVLEPAEPFLLVSTKTGDGRKTTGVVPTKAARKTLETRIGDGENTLQLASGVPDDEWTGVVGRGLDALNELKSGRLVVEDKKVLLVGVSASPEASGRAAKILDNLPEGYEADVVISQAPTGMTAPLSSGQPTSVVVGEEPAVVAGRDATAPVVVGETQVPEADTPPANVEDRNPVVVGEKPAPLASAEEGTPVIVGQGEAAPSATYGVTYDAGRGAAVSGTPPEDLDRSGIASVLGLATVSGSDETVTGAASDRARGALATLARWLPELEAFDLRSENDDVSVDAEVTAGVDPEQVRENLSQALGPNVPLTVQQSAATPTEGAERINAATGKQERFSRGFWFPVLNFAVSRDECQSIADGALAANRITFVTGSSRLDARSSRAVNEAAAIMRNCVVSGSLKAEVGGHTDSTGDPETNRKLSQERAEVVVEALVRRGVPAGALTAVGYGAAQPIADNETEEGRALNRRTTIIWSE